MEILLLMKTIFWMASSGSMNFATWDVRSISCLHFPSQHWLSLRVSTVVKGKKIAVIPRQGASKLQSERWHPSLTPSVSKPWPDPTDCCWAACLLACPMPRLNIASAQAFLREVFNWWTFWFQFWLLQASIAGLTMTFKFQIRTSWLFMNRVPVRWLDAPPSDNYASDYSSWDVQNLPESL